MREVTIGLDLGTSTYKAAAFDRSGRQLCEATAAPTLAHPRPGWVEQDPADLVETAALALKRLVSSGVDPAEVRGVGMTGQLGGMVLVDPQGAAVGAHEVWLDNRCQPHREEMLARGGAELLDLTGIHPFLAPRLLWRAEMAPEEYATGAKAMQCGPFVACSFAGLGAAGAYNDATSIGIFGVADVRSGDWSDRLCALAGIDASYLPRIVEPWEVIGGITQRWARATGLLPGTPIVAGLGDGIAGRLGCGAVRDGIAVDTVGSSDHLAITVSRYAPDPKERVLAVFRSAISGLWDVFGFTAGSGLSQQWFLREFARGPADSDATDEPATSLEAAARAIAPGSDGLVCVPHLEGRFCPDQPNVRGVFLGFTWKHTRAHFYRSIFEGVAYEYAGYLAAARRLGVASQLAEVRVVGGGAKSALWNQIKSDVLGVEYVQLAPASYACRGVALCVGIGVGLSDDLADTASRGVEIIGRFVPDPERHRRYQAYADHYRSLLVELGPGFNRAARLF